MPQYLLDDLQPNSRFVQPRGVVIFARVLYNQGQQIVGGEGDQNFDSLTIFSNDGAVATGSVTNFLSTLT
jgi:hypothetical protein